MPSKQLKVNPGAWRIWYEDRLAEVRSLDRENIGSWPRWLQGVLLFAALLLGFMLIYLFHVSELRADLHRAQSRLQRDLNEYKQTYKEAARLPAAEAESEVIQGQYETALRQLPDHIDTSAVKAELEMLMKETGVLGQRYTGGSEIIAGEIYDEQRFSYEMQGTYEAFARLTARLANWPRLIILREFTAQRLKASDDQLQVKATFSAFAYRPSPDRSGR